MRDPGRHAVDDAMIGALEDDMMRRRALALRDQGAALLAEWAPANQQCDCDLCVFVVESVALLGQIAGEAK